MASSDDEKHINVKSDKVKSLTKSTKAFNKSLLQMVDSTSTPISSRIHPSKDRELRHDSGFSECSQFWLQSSTINESCGHDQYFEGSPSNVNFSTESVDSTPAQGKSHQSGLQQMLKYYDELAERCPKKQRIGRRVGDEFVDIVTELNAAGIPALSDIFSFLDDKDLLRCEKVSQSWSSALHEDQNTRKRLHNPAAKENLSPVKEENNESQGQSTNSGTPLGSLQVTSNVSPEISPTSNPEDWVPENIRFKSFANAAKQLKTGEQVVKCTRCFGPAKLFPESRRATCVGLSCKYDYCTLCELEFHGAKNCIVRPNKKIRTDEKPIGSKASKKNLKRL